MQKRLYVVIYLKYHVSSIKYDYKYNFIENDHLQFLKKNFNINKILHKYCSINEKFL